MHGGTSSSGRVRTAVAPSAGSYWMSCITSFSNTTAPGETAMLRPSSKADSSVVEMRPRATSSTICFRPRFSVSPPDSTAMRIASGLVAAKFAGLIASTIWRAAKRARSRWRSSASSASTLASMNSALIR